MKVTAKPCEIEFTASSTLIELIRIKFSDSVLDKEVMLVFKKEKKGIANRIPFDCVISPYSTSNNIVDFDGQKINLKDVITLTVFLDSVSDITQLTADLTYNVR